MKDYGKICSQEKIKLSMTLLFKKKKKSFLINFKNIRKITS